MINMYKWLFIYYIWKVKQILKYKVNINLNQNYKHIKVLAQWEIKEKMNRVNLNMKEDRKRKSIKEKRKN